MRFTRGMTEPQMRQELTVGKHTSVTFINKACPRKEEINAKGLSMGVSVCLPI
jgi:hypothetical protein